jgi:hypothetical protein
MKPNTRKRHSMSATRTEKLRESLTIAEEQGLLAGERTQIIRGRMPRALVERARQRTGIDSDTELLQVTLAHIAAADDYADWLLSRRGTVPNKINLEF